MQQVQNSQDFLIVNTDFQMSSLLKWGKIMLIGSKKLSKLGAKQGLKRVIERKKSPCWESLQLGSFAEESRTLLSKWAPVMHRGLGQDKQASWSEGSSLAQRWKGFIKTARLLYRLGARLFLYKLGGGGSLLVFLHFNLFVTYHVKHTFFK